jgi:hypothetical protein
MFEAPAPSPVIDTPRESVSAQVTEAPAQAPAPARSFDAPWPPEPRAFDFDQPAAAPTPPPAPPREATPVDPVVREPAPVATATEPREWTRTPATDVETPRNEP